MRFQEAVSTWNAHKALHEENGAYLSPGVKGYIPDEFRKNYAMAMDALPSLVTDPNGGIPSFLSMFVDPKVFEVLFAPSKAAEILGEVRKGTWLDGTAMFPVVEHTGEVSSYGDYNNNGRAGVNTNFPQRQSYLYQTIKEYGELEIERAGLAKIQWVSEIDQACALVLSKFQNLTYFYGVQGLQNYGLLNDPNLTAAIQPALKAWGNGTNRTWYNGTVVAATANEIFNDIQSLVVSQINQSGGLVDTESEFVLAMSPASEAALTQTNTFAVNVVDLLKKNFPKMRIVSAVQYGALSATNPQGVAAGNMMQIVAPRIEGQEAGYCAFNEKLRSHRIVPDLSSFKQKNTAGTWGSIIRLPLALSQMIGI